MYVSTKTTATTALKVLPRGSRNIDSDFTTLTSTLPLTLTMTPVCARHYVTALTSSTLLHSFVFS